MTFRIRVFPVLVLLASLPLTALPAGETGLSVKVPSSITWPGATPGGPDPDAPEVLHAMELPTLPSEKVRLHFAEVSLGVEGALLVSTGGGSEFLVYVEEDVRTDGTLETAFLPGGGALRLEVLSAGPTGGESFALSAVEYVFDDPGSPEAIAAQVEAGFHARSPSGIVEWDGRDWRVIYGTDSRQEIHAVEDPQLRAMAESVALVTNRSQLTARGDGGWDLRRVSWTSTAFGSLCADEPFRGQPTGTGGDCTGFLVGPDLFVTAGHCISAASCSGRAFVFGYRMNEDGSPPDLVFGQEDVLFCQEIVARQFGGGRDWAIVRLDRQAAGREGLPLRAEGEVPQGTPLAMIGHPVALPTKMASDATVMSESGSSPHFFQANLDAYGGNSGSPVINTQTGLVEGILVRGVTDFRTRPGEGCVESNRVPHSGGEGTLQFEEVSRTTDFVASIPGPMIPPAARAAGDLTNDGCTGFRDFVFLLENWGLEVDGTPLGMADFTNILEHWGEGCDG